MKWSEADRRFFKRSVNGQSFTLQDIEAFVKPAFQWDAESARDRALTALAYNFIKSFRGKDGIREAIAFNQAKEDEPMQMAFSFYGACEDTSVIKRQIKYMEAKQAGMGKTIAKLRARKIELETQSTILDFLPNTHLQQAQPLASITP